MHALIYVLSECQKHRHQYTENGQCAGPQNGINCCFHNFILLSHISGLLDRILAMPSVYDRNM